MVHLDEHNFTQTDFNEKSRSSRKRLLSVILLISSLAVISWFSFFLGGRTNAVGVQNESSAPFWQMVASIFGGEAESTNPNYSSVPKENNRLDILILGIRGEDDPDAKDGGPLLTDAMLVFSFDKTNKKASIVSIPRDLYVKIDKNKEDKINAAYEYGYYHKGDGISYTKELISKVTGVYVDKVIVLDFSSFEKIIDDVGGIDIVLAAPFSESQQWGYKFSLPAGPNHLDGVNALYYMRSRFSTSDFDRSRRQQELMFALKNKLTNLNFWSDPIKTIAIFNSIRSNIKTDINIWNIKELIDLTKEIDSSDKIKKYIISTDNLVYESHTSSGSYILLPKGDNFTQIKQLFQDVLK